MSTEVPLANTSRYDQAAATYSTGRMPYSPKLFEHLVASSGIGPKSTVLDLGCGPGTIANEIAKHCGHVIAVDPSQAMIEAGRANAPSNVTYIQGSSDDLSFIDRPIDVVTFGRSFHWMDREKLLDDLDPLMTKDACLAFFNVMAVAGQSPDHLWYKAMYRTAKQLADVRKTGDKTTSSKAEPATFLLMRSAFSEVTMQAYYEHFDWTFERATAWVLSRYATGAVKTADRLPEIEKKLRKALSPYGRGPWTARVVQKLVIAKRPST